MTTLFLAAKPPPCFCRYGSLGGGSRLDTGGYPITFSRFAFGEVPVSVQADTHIDPLYGVDTRAGLILRFPGDGIATLSTGLDAVGGPGAALFGDEGWIELPTPYHPIPKSESTLHTRTATETFEFDTGALRSAPVVTLLGTLDQTHVPSSGWSIQDLGNSYQG